MREININIEGYNVNGICVGCLNYGRKMFNHEDVKDCFKILADIDVPDGLSIQVCWECMATIRTVTRFQAQVLHSYEVLIDYSRKHTFLNSPLDLTQYAVQRLTAMIIEDNVQMPQKAVPQMEVKDEFEGKYDIELELPSMLAPPIKEESDYSQDIPDDYLSQDMTSEDDIQLSQLKKEKEKKKKFKKKGKENTKKTQLRGSRDDSRKLKNLPPDMVELYTMTEEEMWQTRNQDLEDKEFTKLKYKCENCLIGFNTEKLMAYHMIGKHRAKSTEAQHCDVCKAYFLTKDNLYIHRALHLKAYKCTQCNYLTCMKRSMCKHVRGHGASLVCHTCGGEFNTKSKLNYHKNVCHQEKPQCDCCGKVFANKMTLKYHLNSKLTPQAKPAKPKEKLYIPCKGCNKVFYSKKSYRAHVVIHDGLTYPCPICGKLFQWKRNLARHTRNHRERDAGNTHECRECGKTFSSRDCYNNHMRLSKKHVPEDAYGHECSYCGKKFATKWCMVDHIDWDHLKRIKYQCRVCFKAFKTAKIMVAHMNNIHEGKKSREPEGEHLCEICGKSYKTVKRLKGHVWAMHTNRSTTKSFKCKLCPATFTWQTSIYKHTKMMHDNNKRSKQPRTLPSVKKQDPYPAVELAPRMIYFPTSQPAPALPDVFTHC